jgi:hypothetical protein
MSKVRNINVSKIIFDLPMKRSLMSRAIKINNRITFRNTGTMGQLPRWQNKAINNNYPPVVLKKNENFPGMYIIQNGRHRIAKLYSEGKRSVRAIVQ